MDVNQINRVIAQMCDEVMAIEQSSMNWLAKTEEELLEEVTVCTFSSQMRFEMALAASKLLKDEGLFHRKAMDGYYPRKIREVFEGPVEYIENSTPRYSKMRFPNRLSNFLAATVDNIYSNGGTIHSLLRQARTAGEA